MIFLMARGGILKPPLPKAEQFVDLRDLRAAVIKSGLFPQGAFTTIAFTDSSLRWLEINT